jgi:hypothetical protein
VIANPYVCVEAQVEQADRVDQVDQVEQVAVLQMVLQTAAAPKTAVLIEILIAYRFCQLANVNYTQQRAARISMRNRGYILYKPFKYFLWH